MSLYGRHSVDCGHLGCWPCARDHRLAATDPPRSAAIAPPPVEPLLPAAPGGGAPIDNKGD